MSSKHFFSASGSSLTSRDFANGEAYNAELGTQDAALRREHFDKAMKYHQVFRSTKTLTKVLRSQILILPIAIAAPY